MKVLIVDDHHLVTQGLSQLIEAQLNVLKTVEVHDKQSLFQRLEEDDYDLLLLDIRLGKDDARSFIKKILSRWENLKVIAISSHNDSGTIQSTLNLGIHGYISKNESTDKIIEAINTVLSGKRYLSNELKAEYVDQSLKVDTEANEINLTKREKEVLNEVLNELSNKEIAKKLFISEKTVENHRSNLFMKFGVKNAAGLVKKAIIMGFMD